MGTPNLQRHYHRDGASNLMVLDVRAALAELAAMSPEERLDLTWGPGPEPAGASAE